MCGTRGPWYTTGQPRTLYTCQLPEAVAEAGGQAFLSGDLARWRGVLEGELTKLYPHRKARCGWCGSDGAEALRPSAAWAGTDRTWDGTGGRRAPSQQAEVEVRPAVKGTG